MLLNCFIFRGSSKYNFWWASVLYMRKHYYTLENTTNNLCFSSHLNKSSCPSLPQNNSPMSDCTAERRKDGGSETMQTSLYTMGTPGNTAAQTSSSIEM